MNFFPKIFKQLCMSCRYTISFPVCLPYVRYTWWLSVTLLVLNPYFRTHFWAESTNLNSASLHEKTCLYTVRLLSQSGKCNSIYLLFFISRHSACGTRTLVSFGWQHSTGPKYPRYWETDCVAPIESIHYNHGWWKSVYHQLITGEARFSSFDLSLWTLCARSRNLRVLSQICLFFDCI